jgi:site-specific recombinase XerD
MAKGHGSRATKRGKKWRVVVYDAVSGRQRSFTAPTKARAEALGKRRHGEFADRAREIKEAGLTKKQKHEFTRLLELYKKQGADPLKARLSDLLTRYKTEKVAKFTEGGQRAYKNSLDVIELYWITPLAAVPTKHRKDLPIERDPLLHDLDSEDVAKFLLWRETHPLRGKGLGDWTLKKDRATLRTMFQFAIQHKLLDTNPVVGTDEVEPEERETPELTDTEYTLLQNECQHDDMLALFVLMMGETGARSESEVLWLKWEHIHWTVPTELAEFVPYGYLTIKSERKRYDRKTHRTKTGKSRDVPMEENLRDALAAHAKKYEHAIYDGVRSPWVFTYQETRGKQHVAGQRIKSLRYRFKRAVKRAGIDVEFRQHDMRHAYITRKAGEGFSLELIAENVGHTGGVAMTKKYTHLKLRHRGVLVRKPQQPQEPQPVAN